MNILNQYLFCEVLDQKLNKKEGLKIEKFLNKKRMNIMQIGD